MLNLFNFDPQTLIALAVILFVAFPVHELAHAYTADAFGDPTPRNSGRLTINPLAHLDVMGTLLLIVTRGFGWAKPVPINPYALQRRSPAAVMWVSLAGPLSNLGMAILGAIPWRLGLVTFAASPNSAEYWGASILYEFIIINLGLMLFNLIPIAPLDGEKVLDYFLPPSWARTWQQFSMYGPIVLMAILFLAPLAGFDVLGAIMGPPLRSMLHLLLGVPA